jgi:outer membrane murein-binding lipoprotein Lpp
MKPIWNMALVLVVAGLGLWGCARQPSVPALSSERVRQLEARCVKLEQDYATVANARDAVLKEAEGMKQAQQNQARQLEAAQGEVTGLRKQLHQRSAERDTLLAQVNERTSERDGLLQRMDKVKKGLRELLSQEESPAAPAGSTTGPVLPGTLGVGAVQ